MYIGNKEENAQKNQQNSFPITMHTDEQILGARTSIHKVFWSPESSGGSV